MGLLQFLSGPVKVLMDGAQNIINQFVASPEQKMQAQQALLDVQEKLNEAIIASDKDFAEQQAQVIEGEEKSESWMARNWRPMLMLVFTFIIAYNYVIAPIFSTVSTPIPPDMWELLKLGITGYIVGRSVEKTAPSIVAAITNKKDANAVQ